MSDVGFGIVGLGMGADRARKVAKTPGAKLVAVCDLDPTRLRDVMAEHGCQGTADYHVLLRRDDIEVVYVMMPSGLHGKVAIDAARAGKHVITTKPIETTLEKADAMIEACDRAGVKLLVDFDSRYNADVNRIKLAMDRQLFGDIILAEARLKCYRDDSYYVGWHGTWEFDGGGSIINQAVHYMDLLCWYMGMPETVRGRIGVYNHDIETEDMSLAMLHYPNGAEGMIVTTTTFPEGWYFGMEIHGKKGGVIFRDGEMVFWKTDGDVEVEVPDLPSCAADEMVRALRKGEPVRCDGREGRKSLVLIRAVIESAQNGEKLVTVRG